MLGACFPRLPLPPWPGGVWGAHAGERLKVSLPCPLPVSCPAGANLSQKQAVPEPHVVSFEARWMFWQQIHLLHDVSQLLFQPACAPSMCQPPQRLRAHRMALHCPLPGLLVVVGLAMPKPPYWAPCPGSPSPSLPGSALTTGEPRPPQPPIRGPTVRLSLSLSSLWLPPSPRRSLGRAFCGDT